MSHTVRDKKKLLTRTHRIQGQLAALERALEQEKECMAILQQIAAVRGAITGLMNEVLEGQMREHLGDDTLTAAQRGREIDQLVSLLRTYLR